MKKLCIAATIPEVVFSFMKGQVLAASKEWKVTIVSNSGEADAFHGLGAAFEQIPIRRQISPLHDLVSLVRLMFFFRRERFDLVHSIMPKTGLLAMMAARMVNVPNRVHTFTGQVWATKRGWLRSLLKFLDKLIVSSATLIIVDSPSQRDFLIKEGVLPDGKGQVIGNGSICGVDAQRFKPDIANRHAVREELNIQPGQIVLLYLGRLNIDKGIPELALAFAGLADQQKDVVLLLVGNEENVSYSMVQQLSGIHRNRLRKVGFTQTPERYMAAADILCLPSHREGFGQVVIEAAACGVPTVASAIYGISDAVDEGKTGLLFEAGNTDMLRQQLMKLVGNPELRLAMGEAARARSMALFPSQKITEGLMNFYRQALA